MWLVQAEDLYLRRHREFEAKHREVLRALLSNLETYLQALKSGLNPISIKGGFLHPEKHHGMAAVDTKGARSKQPAARLYFYPDVAAEVLFLLSIGFKDTQETDLRACRQLVDRIRKGSSDD